jgi:hypothetical protein
VGQGIYITQENAKALAFGHRNLSLAARVKKKKGMYSTFRCPPSFSRTGEVWNTVMRAGGVRGVCVICTQAQDRERKGRERGRERELLRSKWDRSEKKANTESSELDRKNDALGIGNDK